MRRPSLAEGWMGQLVELTVVILAMLLASGVTAAVAGLALNGSSARGKELYAGLNRLAARMLRSRKEAAAVPPGVSDRREASPHGLLALALAAGLGVIALMAVGLGKLVGDVTEGDGVAVLDRPVAHFVVSQRIPEITSVMRAASTVGGPAAMVLLALAVGLLLSVSWRSWLPIAVLVATAAGIIGLTVVFKAALGRARPPSAQAVAAADGYGFPSGHAAAAAAVCGVAAWLITSRMRSRLGRAAVWAVTAMLAVLVGVSRVYLGVHWTTDVLGGWIFGILWMAVVISGWAMFGSHRR